MAKNKDEIVTFKADQALLDAMKGIANRSEFIRRAILAALDGSCPLCKGTGILPPEQKAHWDNFLRDHSIQQCEKCRELYIVCSNRPRRTRRAE